jgi:hypothetical protein
MSEKPMSTTIYGVVAANGSIITGTGFSATNTAQGVYAIAFNHAFRDVPAAVATQGGNFPNPSNSDSIAIGTLTNASMIVSTGDGGGQAQNRQFSFIAIG